MKLIDVIRRCLPSCFLKSHQESQEVIDATSPSRSITIGTIYGHPRGRVTISFQQDPTIPPPFLFELSMATHLLAREMRSGVLRIALECGDSTAGVVWKAYCNGRKVGYAVKRRPTEKDRRILTSVSPGAGVLLVSHGDHDGNEVMYMRASYEQVVGSRDSVSYHLINPAGSPPQELSVFLFRSG